MANHMWGYDRSFLIILMLKSEKENQSKFEVQGLVLFRGKITHFKPYLKP